MDVVLRTESVNRDFRTPSVVVHALADITMTVRQGSFAVLVGPSGSGKTTLINILGALDFPSTGDVYFAGRKINTLSSKERDEIRRKEMGFVFQSIALISLMSAFENVDFGLRIAGIGIEERERRAEECLTLVGLHRRMHHRPSELSGGEQQRVAIARAIAHRPRVLFADEPTAELDTHTGLQVVKLFKELIEDQGVTVVMSSHDPNIIELAEQVYNIDDGRIANPFGA